MTLKDIVVNLLDSADSSSHDFRRLYNIGVFGMQTEFGLDVKSSIKTVLLDINPNKTCALPCDYVMLSKMGVVNSYGEIATFKRNDRLSMYHAEYFINANRNAGVPTLPTYGWYGGLNGGIADYNAFGYLNYWYQGTSWNLFGLGSGTVDVGEYKIDTTNRIILFNECFNWTQFLLEYITDGSETDENDQYPVDVRMAEAVKSWLRWQDVIDRPRKASPGAIQQLKTNYFNEKRKARMRINPIILNEMQNIERRSWRMVAKA